LQDSEIFNNGTGVTLAPSALGFTFGNNAILGNGVDFNGTLMATPLQ